MLGELEATKVLQEPAASPLWGEWIRRKISLALTLTALVPLLVLAYSVFASVMSWPPRATRDRTRARCNSALSSPTYQMRTSIP